MDSGALVSPPNLYPLWWGERKCVERKMTHFLSPRRVSPFLAWGDFHARSRFARSTIPEDKWGTTRGLLLISIISISVQRIELSAYTKRFLNSALRAIKHMEHVFTFILHRCLFIAKKETREHGGRGGGGKDCGGERVYARYCG